MIKIIPEETIEIFQSIVYLTHQSVFGISIGLFWVFSMNK